MSVITLSAPQLKQKLVSDEEKPFLLDVREEYEFDLARIEGSVLIPLARIPQRVDEIERQKEIVVICHHGIRSLHAAQYLADCGFVNVYNLQGGIDAWSRLCDPQVARY